MRFFLAHPLSRFTAHKNPTRFIREVTCFFQLLTPDPQRFLATPPCVNPGGMFNSVGTRSRARSRWTETYGVLRAMCHAAIYTNPDKWSCIYGGDPSDVVHALSRCSVIYRTLDVRTDDRPQELSQSERKEGTSPETDTTSPNRFSSVIKIMEAHSIKFIAPPHRFLEIMAQRERKIGAKLFYDKFNSVCTAAR